MQGRNVRKSCLCNTSRVYREKVKCREVGKEGLRGGMEKCEGLIEGRE